MANGELEPHKLANQQLEVSTQQVERYLQQHPQFFNDHELLLQQMQLQHGQQGASSLLERQNSVLRQKNAALEQRLQQFIEHAKANEQLFQSVRQCMLSLLLAVDLQQLCLCVKHNLQALFNTDSVRVFLFNVHCEPDNSWLSVDQALLKAYLPSLFDSTDCICGEFDRDLRMFLFADTAIKSAGIAPLLDHQQQAIGFMVLGSVDANYYNPAMDTLFLTYLSQVMAIEVCKHSR